MPQPSRTCAFGVSSKAIYYSLPASFLKTFCFLTALYDLGTVVLQNESTTHTLYDKGTSFSYCETSRLL